MADRAWDPPPLLLCGGMGARPHTCRDGGRCRHLDSPPRHSALEQDTVLPLLSACQPCFFNCLSPSHALKTGWHRSCTTTAHKKQPLSTTRRKAADGLRALEALPPQTLPVLYTFSRLGGADPWQCGSFVDRCPAQSPTVAAFGSSRLTNSNR